MVATQLIAVQKVDPRTVAGVLGHTSATTTLRIYSHLIPAYASDAVDALDDELGKARDRRAAADRKA